MTAQRWGVVGGGMLGMSLALWLSDRGHAVTIIEAADELGGLASAWEIGDITWDRHYHVILNSDRHLLSLLDRLALTDDLTWVETRTGVYSGGELFSVSNSIEYLKFPPLRIIDKVRMGWTILYGSRIKDWRSLEQVHVEDWLRKHSGDNAFEVFWLPLLRSKLGNNYKRTSAAFIWTTIQRLYAARRSGLKKEMFGYVRGGYARIIDRLAQLLRDEGIEALLGARVAAIREHPDGVAVDIGESLRLFDRVVVTTSSPLASRMISDLTELESRSMREVDYQGIVCASILSDRGLGGFYVTNITDQAPFTGVIEMSALVDRSELGGRHLIYLPKYTGQDDAVLSMTDEEVQEVFISSLSEMFPDFDRSDVVAFKVSRVPYVFPIPTVGYSQRVPPMKTSVPGVYAVSSAQILNGTLNVNETLQLAARALPVITDQVDYTVDILESEVEPVLTGADT